MSASPQASNAPLARAVVRDTTTGALPMLRAIFVFDLRYHLRGPLFFIACLVFFLFAFAGTASEHVTIGENLTNLKVNAHYTIVLHQFVFSIIAMFAAMAFSATALTRDVEFRSAELLNATPLRPIPLLLGRFSAAYLTALAVASATLLGELVGSFAWWLDPERLLPLSATPYLYAFFAVLAPNLFIECALFFGLAAWTRSAMAGYVAAIALAGIAIVAGMNTDQETIHFTALIDPFGLIAFKLATRYFTVYDKNLVIPALSSIVFWNRAIWLSASAALLAWVTLRYKLRLESRQRRAAKHTAADRPPALVVVPSTSTQLRLWECFRSQIGLDLRYVFTSVPFIAILLFGLLNSLGSLMDPINEAFGTPFRPVTGSVVGVLNGTFTFTLSLIIVYYAAELIHREREARISDVIDATALPGGVMVAAKITTLLLVVISMLMVATIAAIAVQLSQGFTDIKPTVYLLGLFFSSGGAFFLFVPLAVLLQVLVNNKYLGMLAFVALFLVLNVMDGAGYEHPLYQYGLPGMVYSDMNGYTLYLWPTFVLFLYWACLATLFAIAAHLFWPRGQFANFSQRMVIAAQRWHGGTRMASLAFGAAFVGLGAFLFYNTNFLEHYQTADDKEKLQADYEKQFKRYAYAPQPDVIDTNVRVDIFPQERRVESRGSYVLRNFHNMAIQELRINIPAELHVNHLIVTAATEVEANPTLGFYRWRLAAPLAPGGQTKLDFDFTWRNDGFVFNRPNTQVVENGTFVDNVHIMPVLGYNAGRELVDNAKRRKYALPPARRALSIDSAIGHQASMFTVGSRTSYHAIVSTSLDQTAITPGYLQRHWQADGRNYFEYQMDKPIWPYVSFSSARYAVQRDHWQDVALEIYYDPQHPWNLPSMMTGAKESLAYFSREFAPYQYKQFRIMEFPGYRQFAESFANTVPFSEGIGFVADLRDPKYIDYVLYVTAHEAAHQWWGHQLAGADVQGATMLSESLAQYSALMVMEHHFGREKMRRFLKYELDRYLRGRGTEVLEELPLGLVEGQPYIHYRKGSLALYALKDSLGETRVNQALQRFLKKFADAKPPFADTRDLIAEFRAGATPEQQQLITDLFDRIVLFDLHTTKATRTRRADGKYLVSIDADARKFVSDGKGREHEVPLNQSLDIGVFSDSPKLGEDDLPPVLYLTKHAVHSGHNHFDVVIDSSIHDKPGKVGVDPMNIMIDKTPDDNVLALSDRAH